MRDEMLSINVDVYDARNRKTIIRMRFCPVCHREKQKELSGFEWVDDLRTEAEIMIDPGLAANCDVEFDDSEGAMRKKGTLDDEPAYYIGGEKVPDTNW
jgi:hypothetical protein